MKYCVHCGAQIPDETVLCPQCGCVADQNGPAAPNDPAYQGGPAAPNGPAYQGGPAAPNGPAYQGGPVYAPTPVYVAPSYPAPAQESTMKLIAKIFMLISCILMGFYLIPLAWTIPMTVSYWHSVKEHRPVGVGFKVCSLLFVSLIAGILMLCDRSPD